MPGKRPGRTAQQVFGKPGQAKPMWSAVDQPFDYEVAKHPAGDWVIRNKRSKTMHARHPTEEKANAHLADLQKKSRKESLAKRIEHLLDIEKPLPVVEATLKSAVEEEGPTFSDLVEGLVRGDKMIEERRRGRSR